MIEPYFNGNGSRKDECPPIGIERNCAFPIMGYNSRFRKSHRAYDKAICYGVCAWCIMLNKSRHLARLRSGGGGRGREGVVQNEKKTTHNNRNRDCIVYIPIVYIMNKDVCTDMNVLRLLLSHYTHLFVEAMSIGE